MRFFFIVFVIDCAVLGWVGAVSPDFPLLDGALTAKDLGLIGTIYYFAFFLLIMPIVGLTETPKPLPEGIHESVLARSGKGVGKKSDGDA